MVTYTGVDWLTMTSTDPNTGEAWWRLFEIYRDSLEGEEPPAKQFDNRWYSGHKIGQVSWGHNPERGWIFVASGEAANNLWLQAVPPKHRVTRVDLACDLQLSQPQKLASTSYDLVQRANSNLKLNYSLIQNNKGGTTLYVGSRNSAQFGRLYDKGVQAERAEKGHLWRYEVEFKRPLADAVMDEFTAADPDERAEVIGDTVLDWFENRGVLVPQNGDRQHAMQLTVEKRVTTYDRKLAWLRTQVRPSVRELVEAGLGAQVVNALMLPVETDNERV